MKKGLKVLRLACFAKPRPLSSDSPTASVSHVVMESGTSSRNWASPDALTKNNNNNKVGKKRLIQREGPGNST